MEQVSKAVAESGLIQAGAILPGPRFLSRGSALGRIPPPSARQERAGTELHSGVPHRPCWLLTLLIP